MRFLDWLTGNDIKKSKNCYFETFEDDNKYGKWVYTCKVTCPKSDVRHIVRCCVEDIKTKPIYKCSCGESFELFSAPYKTYMRNNSDIFYHEGSMLVMSTGKYGLHSVRIEGILVCEQDW